ncbi:hypothetical protein GOV03_04140 [Candidatus Woesearchaeota archaeon]|nr:hypothetical protein [Candidatus Woesearchaeota archaeon]
MTKLKKLSVLLVLAIFMLSLAPLALADQGNNRPDQLRAVEKGIQVAKKQLTVNSLKNTMGKAVDGLEKAKKNVEQFQERYERAKENYQAAKDNYLAAKGRVSELRDAIQGCIEGECEVTKKQFRVKSRDVLIHLSDVVLETLNKLKTQVESSDMSEEAKEQTLADLDAQILEVEEAKAILEDLSEDITREELKDAVDVIKDAWKSTRPQIKLGLGKVIGAKLGNIIVKTEQLETKFNKIRDRLETKGYDVSSLDDYLVEFNAKLASAKEHWELSMEKFREARTAEDVSAAVQEAHRHQAEAREEIKEAREDIRNIVKEIKSLQDLDEIEEEIEEEEEETDDEDETDEEDEEESEDDETDDEDETDEEDEEETEDEEELEVKGTLTEEQQAQADEILAKIKEAGTEVELKIKVEWDEDSETAVVEKNELEGEVSEEVQALIDSLIESLQETVNAENEEVKVEIDFELAEEEDEEDEEE